jgi:ferredoxin
MSYVIAEPCLGCKDRGCAAVCPVDAIHEGKVMREGREYDQLFINPAECIDCGICEPECPVEAIYPQDELPEKWLAFRVINAEFYGE